MICALHISHRFLVARRGAFLLFARELLARGHSGTLLHLESGLLLLGYVFVGEDAHIASNAIGDRIILFLSGVVNLMMDADLIRRYLAVRIVHIGASSRLDIYLTVRCLIELLALIVGDRQVLLRVGRTWNRVWGGSGTERFADALVVSCAGNLLDLHTVDCGFAVGENEWEVQVLFGSCW